MCAVRSSSAPYDPKQDNWFKENGCMDGFEIYQGENVFVYTVYVVSCLVMLRSQKRDFWLFPKFNYSFVVQGKHSW